jgi:hypothetical protein
MEVRTIDTPSRGPIRLIHSNEWKRTPSSERRFLVLLVALGIVLLSWPFLEPHSESIESWIDENRSVVSIVCLSAIAAVAALISRIERSLEPTGDDRRLTSRVGPYRRVQNVREPTSAA